MVHSHGWSTSGLLLCLTLGSSPPTSPLTGCCPHSAATEMAEGRKIEPHHTKAHCTWFSSNPHVPPVKFGRVEQALLPMAASGCAEVAAQAHLACFSNPSAHSLPATIIYCSGCQWDDCPHVCL